MLDSDTSECEYRPVPITVGAILKQLRRSKRVNQEELAAAASLNASTLSEIENGKVDPQFSSVAAIAAALASDGVNLFRALAEAVEGGEAKGTVVSSDTVTGTDQGSSEADAESDSMMEALKKPQIRKLVAVFDTLNSRDRSEVMALVLEKALASERGRSRPRAKNA